MYLPFVSEWQPAWVHSFCVGGTKGKRFALPHSTIMIHQPSGGAQGQATEIQIVADHIAQTKRTLNEILAEKHRTAL